MFTEKDRIHQEKIDERPKSSSSEKFHGTLDAR